MKWTALLALSLTLLGCASASGGDARQCDQLAKLIAASDTSELLKLQIEIDPDSKDGRYQGLDVDGDKVDDFVVASCPASLSTADACTLTMKLSSTGARQIFRFEPNERFFLARIDSNLFAIVNHNKPGSRAVVSIDKSGFRRTCSKL